MVIWVPRDFNVTDANSETSLLNELIELMNKLIANVILLLCISISFILSFISTYSGTTYKEQLAKHGTIHNEVNKRIDVIFMNYIIDLYETVYNCAWQETLRKKIS